jgi:mono/diheme cytochrome c family protein
MKNVNRIFFVAVIFSAITVFSLIPVDAYSQKKTQQETLSAFSDPVSGIFKNSCVGCHSDQSNSKAKTFLNLSEWDKLSLKKQVKTGKSIYKIVNKGAMPPQSFLKRKPDAALTAEQVESIGSWVHSIRKNN